MSKLNLIGQKFNMLTVIEQLPSENRHTKWLCKCECGNTIAVASNHLKQGHTKSCGCLKNRSKATDLIGKRFGMLKVVGFAGVEKGRAKWQCVCDCGNIIDVLANNLRSGNTKSCGCISNNNKNKYRCKHGKK